MSLQARVIARIPAARLAELTNRDSNSATTANATILGLACADAAARFGVLTGAVYDDLSAADIAFAVDGVVALLRFWASGDESAWTAWQTKAERHGKTTGRNRSLFTTSSRTYPSNENPDNDPDMTPDMDDSAFDGYKPNQP